MSVFPSINVYRKTIVFELSKTTKKPFNLANFFTFLLHKLTVISNTIFDAFL